MAGPALPVPRMPRQALATQDEVLEGVIPPGRTHKNILSSIEQFEQPLQTDESIHTSNMFYNLQIKVLSLISHIVSMAV